VHWEKMNGVQVHPRLFTKVMDVSKKNRKHAPRGNIKNKLLGMESLWISSHVEKKIIIRNGHHKYIQSEQTMEEDGIAGEEEDVEDPSFLQACIVLLIYWNEMHYVTVLSYITFATTYHPRKSKSNYQTNTSSWQDGIEDGTWGMRIFFMS
jgi:hypothetical protein